MKNAMFWTKFIILACVLDQYNNKTELENYLIERMMKKQYFHWQREALV